MPLPKRKTEQPLISSAWDAYMSIPEEHLDAWNEFLAAPETSMTEFIDGKVYMMAGPNRVHQKLSMVLSATIFNHIRESGLPCEVYTAPFDVKVDEKKDNIVEPDISVICDESKLTEAGCVGAPDWIIEIVSPSNAKHDYIEKLALYLAAGVREYWIVDPEQERVMVYPLENKDFTVQTWTFKDSVPVGICEGFAIDFKELS